MAALAPLLLSPIFRNRVWGGDRIGQWLAPSRVGDAAYEEARARGAVGEAWLLADLPATIFDGRTAIASPTGSATTLHDLLANPVTRRALLGRSCPTRKRDHAPQAEAGFGLLVKVLDAAQNLSVQVHPTADYSRRNPHAHMKSEMWYVLDAAADALIYRGIQPDITPAQFRMHVERDTLLEIMIAEPVKRGDCFWLPSGVCHALGAGVLVAEVQTPSDTTFRIWDWGRNDPARPLHIDMAMDCLLLGDAQNLAALTRTRDPFIIHGESVAIESLVRTEYFDVERWVVRPNANVQHDGIGVPVTWTVLDGELVTDSFEHPLRRGSTIVLPAEHTGLSARATNAGVELLVTTLPDHLQNTSEFGGIQTA